MTFEEFGRIISPSQVEEFGRIVSSPQKPMRKRGYDELSWEEQQELGKDVGQQLGIGAALGLGTPGSLLDLLHAQPKETLLPGQKMIAEAESELPEKFLPFLSDEDLIPHYSKLPSARDIEQGLEMVGVDVEPTTKGGKTAQRLGRAVSSAATFGPLTELLGPAALGGGIGGLTEELTGKEWIGDVAEIVTDIGSFMQRGPAAVGKRKQWMKTLEGLGFSPQEITLLSQGEGKLRFLGKLASKDGKMERLFEKIYKKHGNLYDGLRAASKDMGALQGEALDKFSTSLLKTFEELTPRQQDIAQKIVSNIENKPVTFKALMDGIHDLNMDFGKKFGGKKAVLKLKEPLIEGMKNLNPEAGQVFEELQSSYKNFKKIAKKLKPGNIEEILEFGELLAYGKGLFDVATKKGKNGLIVKTLGLAGARKLAREALINPELQGLTIRFAKAVQEGKTLLAEKLIRRMEKVSTRSSATQPTERQQ